RRTSNSKLSVPVAWAKESRNARQASFPLQVGKPAFSHTQSSARYSSEEARAKAYGGPSLEKKSVNTCCAVVVTMAPRWRSGGGLGGGLPIPGRSVLRSLQRRLDRAR